mmetsp:Transcript_89704/g.109810  ORF Transcript_89704/g.109810 Transcript_89704/m.109810 type:complete len:200 (-) Transcript_89704:591-1190(-)
MAMTHFGLPTKSPGRIWIRVFYLRPLAPKPTTNIGGPSIHSWSTSCGASFIQAWFTRPLNVLSGEPALRATRGALIQQGSTLPCTVPHSSSKRWEFFTALDGKQSPRRALFDEPWSKCICGRRKAQMIGDLCGTRFENTSPTILKIVVRFHGLVLFLPSSMVCWVLWLSCMATVTSRRLLASLLQPVLTVIIRPPRLQG